MNELKPCPFCDVNEWKYQSHFSGTTIYQCEKCGTIVEEWVVNTRPIEDALQARIAELEAFIDQLIEAGDNLETTLSVISNEVYVEQPYWQALVDDWKEANNER